MEEKGRFPMETVEEYRMRARTGQFGHRLIEIWSGRLLAAMLLGALGACGGPDRDERPGSQDAVQKIGVNAFLWRASLDTLSALPITQANAQDGVILTDWYADPDNAGERIKVTVTILDPTLRADGVTAVVVRQRQSGINWVNVPVQASTALAIEDAILTRARQLRIQDLSQN